jgi:alpha-ribazole phosphatase
VAKAGTTSAPASWPRWTGCRGLAPDVIVVAHFGPILAALQAAENLSAEEALAHRIDPLSVTCLVLGPAPQVLAVNHHV